MNKKIQNMDLSENCNFQKVETEDDMRLLAELASEIWHDYWKIILSYEQIVYMIEQFQSFAAIKEQIENENYIYKILNCNGVNVGYFGICPKYKPVEHLFLSKLYIKKSSRGKGFGKYAFGKIKQIASALKLKSIRLTVNKHNTNTIKTYEKWGFNIIQECVADIGQGFVMDDYIMEFKI